MEPIAGAGDWPEPRQNPSLTAVQPLGGRMLSAPRSKVTFDLGRKRPEIVPVALADGSGYVGLCRVGGALLCYDTQGRLLWKSHPPELDFDAAGANGPGRYCRPRAW